MTSLTNETFLLIFCLFASSSCIDFTENYMVPANCGQFYECNKTCKTTFICLESSIYLCLKLFQVDLYMDSSLMERRTRVVGHQDFWKFVTRTERVLEVLKRNAANSHIRRLEVAELHRMKATPRLARQHVQRAPDGLGDIYMMLISRKGLASFLLFTTSLHLTFHVSLSGGADKSVYSARGSQWK